MAPHVPKPASPRPPLPQSPLPKSPLPEPASDESRRQHVEKSLDEALGETFPASDPVNLHQWTEMQHEEQDKSEQDARQADRIARYLKGPTAFSA